ncbi:hypothetical protein CHARACLAT_030496 [Characodon lateralis]|uniref:Uncharacterized protein n=1 Tax=Characodon lateralis TaxID=208331 RepID=A0ABU7F9A7_9TELE|nr:hypothetical protein [Characodon lateralis]
MSASTSRIVCLSSGRGFPLLSHPALRVTECSDRLLQMPPFGAAPLGGPNHIPCRTGIVVRSNTNCRSVSIYASLRTPHTSRINGGGCSPPSHAQPRLHLHSL